LLAISLLVAGGSPSIASNRPVRWPIETIKERAPALEHFHKAPFESGGLGLVELHVH
jgi:hypothetical protein